MNTNTHSIKSIYWLGGMYFCNSCQDEVLECGNCKKFFSETDFGLCADCFREAMQESPDNEPAHPSEWEDA